VEEQLDVLGAWLRGNCGGTVGCTWRVTERELWRDCWICSRASG